MIRSFNFDERRAVYASARVEYPAAPLASLPVMHGSNSHDSKSGGRQRSSIRSTIPAPKFSGGEAVRLERNVRRSAN